MRLKHLGVIALSTAAALAALAPASAGAATSSGCENGSFTVTLPGGKTLARGQSAKLAASALPAGSRLHLQGRYVQFDVGVSDFSVYNWALTGAASPQDLTGGRFTPIWAAKVADLKGATLDRELEVKPTDAAGSGLLLQRSGSAKMKIQAKDCATGGVELQEQPSPLERVPRRDAVGPEPMALIVGVVVELRSQRGVVVLRQPPAPRACGAVDQPLGDP